MPRRTPGWGWLCAVDATEGFPASLLGWLMEKLARERSSQVSSVDCAVASTRTLRSMTRFAFF